MQQAAQLPCPTLLPPCFHFHSLNPAYRGATQWRMCFALAAKAGWAPEQQRRLAVGLAEELAVQGRALEAAQLTLQHLGDTDSAGAAVDGSQATLGVCGLGSVSQRPAFTASVGAPPLTHSLPLPVPTPQSCCWRGARSGARRCAAPTAPPGPTWWTRWWRRRRRQRPRRPWRVRTGGAGRRARTLPAASLPACGLGALQIQTTRVPLHPADVNEGIERVAKYGARLVQLRQRRAAMEEALAAAEAESGLPSRQAAAAAAAEAEGSTVHGRFDRAENRSPHDEPRCDDGAGSQQQLATAPQPHSCELQPDDPASCSQMIPSNHRCT